MKTVIACTVAVSMIAVVSACDEDDSPAPPGPTPTYSYQLEEAFPNLTFTRPVDLQNAGDGSDRVFVVEKAGVIRVFPNESTVASTMTFLDISARVNSSGGEQGLLGLAFHPDYGANGRFFVYYTIAGGNNRLSRFEVSAADPDAADPTSEAVLLELPKYQSASNHNGGQVAFGKDGYLYVAVGDGGSAGDPGGNAQDLTTLLGTILRLDADSQSLGNYGIPDTNPFTFSTKGYRGEIYAYGFRNPWRFSFDPVTGWLWAGDVGQSNWEEVDVVEVGGNYGWDCYEGTHPYESSALCDALQDHIAPVHEYGHGDDGYSITGGYVYRGARLTSLVGRYVFADYGSGRIWAITFDGHTVSPADTLFDADFNISSFGVDEANELYILEYSTSGAATKIYQLEQVAD